MTLAVRNQQWLPQNSQRNYPLTHESTRLDATGTFELPTEFLVSLYLPVYWSLNTDPGKFFVYKVTSASTGYRIIIGYNGASVVEVASINVLKSTHTENRSYSVIGQGDFSASRGFAVIGSLDEIEDQPTGEWTFDTAGALLETDVVRPNIQGVSGIQIDNAGELSEVLTGIVRIKAGRNSKFRVNNASEDEPEVIWDAIEGEGLTEDCVCDDEAAPPIRTHDGIPPDGAGNFRWFGNDCLTITGGQNSQTFEDECSEPCCGCEELEAITSALESFGERATTLENFMVSLEASVTQMDLVVLGSRLGDRGCTPAQDCP